MPTLVVGIIVRTQHPMPGSQQLQFGMRRHQPLTCLQYVPHLPGVIRNGGDADQSTAMQIRVPGLSRRDVIATAQLGDNRPDQGALLFQ